MAALGQPLRGPRRCGRNNFSRAALTLVAAVTLAVAATPSARAETSAERFAHELDVAAHGRGLDAHLALGDAQGMASLFADGWDRLAVVARKLAKTSRVPWLRGEAEGALAAATRTGDVAVARAHAKAGGIITTGAVLGPLAGAGVDAVPPQGYDPTTTVTGKIAPVGWRPFVDAAVTADLDVADLLGVSVDAHAFVLSALAVDRPLDVMIVAGSNGPLGVWLDGEELVTWDGERALTDWQHTFPLHLDKGVHHLMVRVGHRSEEARVILRVIAANGLLPSGLTVRVPRPDDVLADHAPSGRLPRALPAMAGDDPALIGRLGLYVATEAATQRFAAQALERAIAQHPDDADLHYFLGLAERTDSSRAVQALEDADALSHGTHASALAVLLDLNSRQGLERQADQIAERLAAIEPTHPAVLAYDAMRRYQLGDANAALPLVERDPRAASNGRLASVRATLLEEAGRVPDAAAAWATVARLADGDPDAVQKAVLAARRAGDIDAAVAYVDDALARRPYAIPLYILKARAVASGPGGPTAGVEVVAHALAVHPDSPELLETQGRLLLLAGDRGGALAAFDRALELAPQNRDLADYRRSLVAGRSLADRFAEPLEQVLAGPAPPLSPQGAVYLLEKHVVSVFPSGLSSRFREVVVRIDADRVTDAFKQMVFPFTPGEDRIEILEAEVLHKDGRRSRPSAVFDHRPDGKQSGVYSLGALKVVRFDELAAGDIVHVQLRQDEVGERNVFGDFFGVLQPLSSAVPKARVEVVVDAPADRQLYAHGERVGAPTRSTDPATGRQTLSWTVNGLAAIPLEPQMPGYGDVGAYVNVSTFASWQALADWYRDLVVPQLPLSPELARTAHDLVVGLDGLRDKVAAVQRWVVKKTRYVGIEFGIHGFKPYKVNEIVKRGYGDCKDKASLMVAMLRAVGVDADFVLVRTRDLGSLADTPATLWDFNHAIAYVPELDQYIDGTSEFSGLGELPDLDQGAMVLRIDVIDPTAPAPTLTHIPIAPPEANASMAQTTYTVSLDGDAAAHFEETIAGSDAPMLRGRLQDVAQRDERIASIIAEQHPGAEVSDIHYQNLDTLGQPVRIDLNARLPGFGRRSGKTLEVPVTLAPGDLLERYGVLAQRVQPLALEHTQREQERAEVHLPAGLAIPTLPPPVDVQTPFGSYAMRFTPMAGGYVIDTLLVVSTVRVEPHDYPAFRAFLEAIARAESTRVVVPIP